MQRAQDLANVTSYREWVLFGYLVCPDELLRVTSIDIALVNSTVSAFPYCYDLMEFISIIHIVMKDKHARKMSTLRTICNLRKVDDLRT